MDNYEAYRLTRNMSKTKVMIFTGLLFAIALILSLVESMFPVLPMVVPGVKFGLSNIVVMYAIFFLGAKEAYFIAILKAIFVFFTRGFVASTLSLSGGLLSITCMLLIFFLLKEKVSIIGISIIGAVSHNIGQFIVVSIIYVGISLWLYLPVLLISGIVTGLLTATLLRILLPVLKRLV
jgi:heptaprenyl diphosphate synthase